MYDTLALLQTVYCLMTRFRGAAHSGLETSHIITPAGCTSCYCCSKGSLVSVQAPWLQLADLRIMPGLCLAETLPQSFAD